MHTIGSDRVNMDGAEEIFWAVLVMTMIGEEPEPFEGSSTITSSVSIGPFHGPVSSPVNLVPRSQHDQPYDLWEKLTLGGF